MGLIKDFFDRVCLYGAPPAGGNPVPVTLGASGAVATYLSRGSDGVTVSIIASADSQSPTLLCVADFSYLYRGAGAGATWDMARTPTVFKSIAGISVTAGTPVAIWTPASGRRFRLMGYCLATTNASGVVVIVDDGASEILRVGVGAGLVPTISPALGNGILSTTANNQLRVDLVSGTATLHGYVYGTEE